MTGLRHYVPLPKAVEFHKADAMYRLIQGGNRSGASLAAAAEVASAATGFPVTDTIGSELPNKYPKNRSLNILVVGYDWNHIGRNIHRQLFEDGAFKLWDGSPAPALIPRHLVTGTVWRSSTHRIFDEILLENGTKITAESSLVSPSCGTQWDLVWVDGDVSRESVVKEAGMRCIDRGGRVIWSAFPNPENDLFRQYCRLAQDGDPKYHHTLMRMDENLHLNQKTVLEVMKGMTEAEIRARVFGEFVMRQPGQSQVSLKDAIKYGKQLAETLSGIHLGDWKSNLDTLAAVHFFEQFEETSQ